jgi:glycerol-3-phosphate acyltransferase PlsX
MITIAVDAMGGDNAPHPEVEGSVLAARELGVRVLLVGSPAAIRVELGKHNWRGLPIETVAASEVISMHDHPAQAFRRKKDSSVHVAARLVREAKAQGLVSAGNTGAVMTVSRFLLGTLESVDRVALAAPFPNAKAGVSVLLDVGANVDSKPEHLVQFAVMGEIYYRATFGSRPAAPCRTAVHRGRGEQGQRADARGARTAQKGAPALRGQRGRRRPVFR